MPPQLRHFFSHWALPQRTIQAPAYQPRVCSGALPPCLQSREQSPSPHHRRDGLLLATADDGLEDDGTSCLADLGSSPRPTEATACIPDLRSRSPLEEGMAVALGRLARFG
jgi:hypothetical protein